MCINIHTRHSLISQVRVQPQSTSIGVAQIQWSKRNIRIRQFDIYPGKHTLGMCILANNGSSSGGENFAQENVVPRAMSNYIYEWANVPQGHLTIIGEREFLKLPLLWRTTE